MKFLSTKSWNHTVKRTLLFCYSVLMLFLLIVFSDSRAAWAEKNPYDWALIQLDYVRQEKVEQLGRFTQKIHSLAREAADDKRVTAFFSMNLYYESISKSTEAETSLKTDVEALRQNFNQYYITKYFAFYDILFVSLNGSVFYSLRKERDHHINLIDHRNTIGRLGEALERNPDQETFIDFYNYAPSSEPAAFFIEPIFIDGVKSGWIILQCAVNKLNSIFSSTEDLGQTGETFLVNHEGLMLTESYFKGYSTILKEHLDDRNIKAKFNEKKGHRIVTDYRGATALSSFEVVEFLGTLWLVVAKIDKDEITTNHYKHHDKYYGEKLMAYLETMPLPPSRQFPPGNPFPSLRVDMDEFLKAEDNEILETWGVSTCTALLAAIPERFGYLAHISPKDKIYGREDTKLLSQMTKKIKSFDIYPSERRELVFVVVATHLDSLINVLNQISNDGFLLSQVNIAYNRVAKSAAVLYHYLDHTLTVTWQMEPGRNNTVQHSLQDTVNVGKIIETIMTDGG